MSGYAIPIKSYCETIDKHSYIADSVYVFLSFYLFILITMKF